MLALRYLAYAFSIMLRPPQILQASQLKPVLPCSIAAAAADCPYGQKKKENKKQAFYQKIFFLLFNAAIITASLKNTRVKQAQLRSALVFYRFTVIKCLRKAEKNKRR